MCILCFCVSNLFNDSQSKDGGEFQKVGIGASSGNDRGQEGNMEPRESLLNLLNPVDVCCVSLCGSAHCGPVRVCAFFSQGAAFIPFWREMCPRGTLNLVLGFGTAFSGRDGCTTVEFCLLVTTATFTPTRTLLRSGRRSRRA